MPVPPLAINVPPEGPQLRPAWVERVNKTRSLWPISVNASYTFPRPAPGKLSTVLHGLSMRSNGLTPGAALTGRLNVAPPSYERNTDNDAAVMICPKGTVVRYTVPDWSSRARMGSPMSPLRFVGNVP